MGKKKDVPKKEKPTFTRKAGLTPKKRKGPRGQMIGKQFNQLLMGIDREDKHVDGVTRRNRYDERLARVAKLARLL